MSANLSPVAKTTGTFFVSFFCVVWKFNFSSEEEAYDSVSSNLSQIVSFIGIAKYDAPFGDKYEWLETDLQSKPTLGDFGVSIHRKDYYYILKIDFQIFLPH